MHVPRRYHSQAPAVVSQSEGDVQAPAVCRLAQRVVSRFLATVPHVGKREQWVREKNLFGLAVGNAVLQVLAAVARVPFEAFDAIQVKHACILL
jgi:hypothetical protein